MKFACSHGKVDPWKCAECASEGRVAIGLLSGMIDHAFAEGAYDFVIFRNNLFLNFLHGAWADENGNVITSIPIDWLTLSDWHLFIREQEDPVVGMGDLGFRG